MKIIKRFNFVVQMLLLLVHLFLFTSFVVVGNIRLRYLYCTVGTGLLLTVLFSVILPIVLFIAGILLSKIKRRTLSVLLQSFCSVMLLLALTLTWISSAMFRGGVFSKTSDPSNYGKYDSYVTETISSENQSNFLPAKADLPADFIYRYGYYYGVFEEGFKVELKVSFEEEIFAKEINRLSALHFENDGELFYSVQNRDFCIGYIINKNAKTIHYVVTNLAQNGEGLLEGLEI